MSQFNDLNTESALNTLRNAIETINDAIQKSAALSALEIVETRLNITSNSRSYEADDGEISDEFRQAMKVFVKHHFPVKGNLRLAGSLLHDL